VVTYRDLLDVFFTIHDPTTRDRQGADVGPQYRSIILYHGPEQQAAAEQAIADLDAKGVWPAPIVTEIAPLERFYPGEAYHQDYFEQNPRQRYCQIVIAPKVAKFRKEFLDKLKR
jgi:peptide-methionine (S)-S-oxide reductase